jgi:hypothetical protein
MALVSPGISISINDQSQYVNSNVGSVPLVILATAQDKTYNNALATGTSKANAGQLLSFTSQRDLVTQMGTPRFQLSASGTPVNGSEINEYGLMSAYSALGLSNQLYAIRADIDLNQLTGTSIRPIGAPVDNTLWLDTVNTAWGIYELDSTNSAFAAVTPLVITNSAQVSGNPSTPLSSIGSIGQYAFVTENSSGATVDPVRLFYKAGPSSAGLNNTWVQVGSANWQNSVPAVVGTVKGATLNASGTFFINGVQISLSGTTPTLMATAINNGLVTGVSASVSPSGQLQIFVTNAAISTQGGSGNIADGKMLLADGNYSPLAAVGIKTSTQLAVVQAQNANGYYYAPILFYGSYAQQPSGGWMTSDAQPRPSGSLWFKTTATGAGFSPVLKQYSSAKGTFASLSVPAYPGLASAIYGLDPVGGGVNIASAQVFVDYSSYDGSSNSLKFFKNNTAGSTNAIGAIPSSSTSGTFSITVTQPGTLSTKSYQVALSSSSPQAVVTTILAQNIPYVTASLTATGNIELTHTAGGLIMLQTVSGTPLGTGSGVPGIGFYANGGSGYTIVNGIVYISNFTNITAAINYSASQPYSAPASGTYWYYSNPTDIDVMINDGTGWKGYLNVSNDSRGYNLSATDPNGVIVSTSAPTSKSTGTGLTAGDLWLDSSDLENYPSLYRYNGTTFVAINNEDHVSSNGIIFADARWDTSGTTDIISGTLPSITSLLTSNYIDLDAPDFRLAPRGALLFNTRRSGYNVKKYVPNYFNASAYPNLPTPPVPGAPTAIPAITSAWVSASGSDTIGKMYAGSKAQRALIVDAMQSAVDSNLDVLSQVYQFNLIVAPNYPELIPNMLTLNDNRGDTAFVIGDTPMDLMPNTTSIANWVNNTNGNGLPSDANASPYLALYYPAGVTNDLAGNQIVVPASHAVLRTYLYNDQVSHPWFAPAGINRGLVTNLNDIGYIDSSTGLFTHNGISQGMRDALFTLNVNPITQLPGSGLVVFGQLTRSADTTARNRVNVVRLENYLRTIFSSISNGYLFEPNDGITRKSIARQIESALNNVLSLRGLYDFLVICDTSNNTPATIGNNQLYVDVAIEPMRDVEFIYIPIAIYNPGSIAALSTTST